MPFTMTDEQLQALAVQTGADLETVRRIYGHAVAADRTDGPTTSVPRTKVCPGCRRRVTEDIEVLPVSEAGRSQDVLWTCSECGETVSDRVRLTADEAARVVAS